MIDHAASLLAAQNHDGGWAYVRGNSWTEPTTYALLALRACGREDDCYLRGLRWLRRMQQADGGFKPHPGVDRSTSVTALALLVCAERREAGECGGAVRWLLASEGRNSHWVERVRARLLGNTEETKAGWPFYPETAAWVAPTALSLLALASTLKKKPDQEVAARIASGQEFLLIRRCADGGWNHGSSRALGYDAGSYPETTGLALLALKHVRPLELEHSIRTAEGHLNRCHSAEGFAWLQLGLRAHGRQVPASAEPACHTIVDHALLLVARATTDGRKGVFES